MIYLIVGEGDNHALSLKTRQYAWSEPGEHSRAIAKLDKAIELGSDDPANYIMRGIIYHESQQYKKALADFEKTLELKPENKTALEFKAETKKKMIVASWR